MKALVGEYDTVPPLLTTEVRLQTQQASQAIDLLREKWDRFKAAFAGAPKAQLPSGANVSVPVTAWATPPKVRAIGGPVTAGMPYLVGEKGPEMFVPRLSGQIIPNNALARSRGSQVVNVYNAVPERASDSIPRALRRAAFANGGAW